MSITIKGDHDALDHLACQSVIKYATDKNKPLALFGEILKKHNIYIYIFALFGETKQVTKN